MANEAESLRVTRGRVDSLVLYDVTEDELEVLTHGPTNSVYLNFAIALIPLGLAFFSSILTVNFENNLITFIVFLVIAIISTLAGLVLLVVWWKSSDPYKNVVQRIRQRVRGQTFVPAATGDAVIPAPADTEILAEAGGIEAPIG